MFVRAYLRASTKEQDASRAKQDLEAFAKEHGLKIAATYEENESGAWKNRPVLQRLLADCQPGDILLVEQVNRLSRLSADDWEALKAEINEKKVKVVALDLPTSHQLLKATESDAFTDWMLGAINGMLLDMLAAIARKDYEDRRRQQRQGITKAKASGKYKGRPENTERNHAIMDMLRNKQSWSTIVDATGASRSTLSRLAQRVKAET